MPLTVNIDDTQKVTVTAAPTDAAGNPAGIDGALTVAVQSGNCTFTQDPASPLSFVIVSGSTPGASVLLVSADADLGAGVQTIQDTVTVNVTAALAQNLGLSVGTPVAK